LSFDFPKEPQIFLFSKASTPGLGPTKPHVQQITEDISLEVKRLELEADNSPHPLPRIKMTGATILL
jgi:hypothetical protein